MVNRALFRIVVLVVIALLMVIFPGASQPSTTQYAFPEKFMVRPVAYQWGGMPVLGMNLVNSGAKSIDSLELHLFFNGPDSEMSISHTPGDMNYELAVRVDIAIFYSESGYQTNLSTNTSFQQQIMSAKLQKMDGYCVPGGSCAWSLALPLAPVVLHAGYRLRLDLVFDSRTPFPPYTDIMNIPPRHIPGPGDWSWGPKKRSDGAPVDYKGIASGTKMNADDSFGELQDALYIAIYRNGKLLWGIPPDWKKYYGEKIDTIPQPLLDPLPYALIANPLNEYTDQLARDSLNLNISRVRVNQAGYLPQDEKLFYYVGATASVFSVVNTVTGAVAGTGTLSSLGLETSGQLKITCYNNAQRVAGGQIKYQLQSPAVAGTVFRGIVPDLPDGAYKVIVGSDTSARFVIRSNVYGMVRDALLKYYGVARCGDNSSWFHPSCHTQDPVPGGWHDAGDHLKVPQSMGYAMAVLGLCAAAFRDVDSDHFAKDQSKTKSTDGVPDMLAEAKIGTDFLINSYDLGGQAVAGMKTDIGNFGDDHSWWGRPEFQDGLPVTRGGPPRPAAAGLGGNTAGTFGAGLAFVGKLLAAKDAAYSAKCIRIAKELYEWGKANPKAYANTAMQSGDRTNDEMALCALALWWATGDSIYKSDLLYDKTIGPNAAPATYPRGGFSGGWMTSMQAGMLKGNGNTGWDNLDAYVLWGMYRLMVIDEATALSYGISAQERLNIIEDILYCQIANIADVAGSGGMVIELPQSSFTGLGNTLKCDSLWGWMKIMQGNWMPNRYQAGNSTELFCYYDIARRIQGTALPNSPATTDWKVAEVKSLLLKQLDYMLGLNPWDVSMIVGVGAKNLNHPHHRAACPELQNVPGAFYQYRPPIGALSGGFMPTVSLYDESVAGMDGYYHTVISLDATTSIFLPVCGMARVDNSIQVRNPAMRYRPDNEPFRVRVIASRGGQEIVVFSKKPVLRMIVVNAAGKRITRKYFSPATATTDRSYQVRLSNGNCGMYVVRIEFLDGEVTMQKVIGMHG